MSTRKTPTRESSANPTRARTQQSRKSGPASTAQGLQRKLGNQATQHLLQTMANPDAAVQRQDTEEDKALQGKFEPLQRQEAEDEEILQGRLAASETPAQPKDDGGAVGNRTGMPDQLKTGLESLSSLDLSNVRVHRNSSKPAQLNALAYTQGQDIHVGPGQEKHLPHEGWHAVQQMQGRVRPTIQAKGVSINDDPGLEHEADVMGTRALQMVPAAVAENNETYRSPALQLRHRLRASSIANPTIQRVTTWAGEYTTDKYELLKAKSLDGVDIVLRFKPNKYVDAELIGMTQIVRHLQKGGPFAIGAGKGKKALESRMVPAGEAGAGFMVDRLPDKKSPLYGTDTPAKSGTISGGVATSTTQHGYRYKDKAGKQQRKDAFIKDTPKLFSKRKESSQVFETTALAVKGVQEGTFYGSVQWGWEKNAAGKVKKLPLTRVSSDVPSSTFNRASELWNKGKTSTGKKTINLPTVSGKYTNTQGVWLVNDPLNYKTTRVGKLAKNTRLEVTDKGAKEPFNKSTNKWWKTTTVEGTHIGKVGWVMSHFLADKKTK